MVKDNEILQKIILVYENTIGGSLSKGNNGKYTIERKLDSIEIMEIVVSLEDEFDIEFDSDELDDDIFFNIETVCGLVNSKIENN